MSDKVSIVIPVFNRAHLVHRAIDSALAQTYQCEVVLCDHGSTDGIDSVVRRYRGRIKYIRKEVDNGPIACWIDGLEHASGDIVHITYDDDWIDERFIEKSMSMLDNDVGFVYSQAYIVDAETGEKSLSLAHPPGKGRARSIVEYLLRQPTTISPGCAIFRKSDAVKNLLPEIPGAQGKYGRNSGVGEDLLLFLLTTLSYPYYAHYPEPLAFFFSHSGSITVDALGSEKRKELYKSYENAKSYYLRQAGAIMPLVGARRIAWRVRWNILSGGVLKKIARKLKRRIFNDNGK